MKYCNLHKDYCEKIINLIQFKKGKIIELNVCMDCLCQYLDTEIFDLCSIDISKIEEIEPFITKNNCPQCGLNKKDLYGSKPLCLNCYLHFNLKENKAILIKNKMAVAIKIEDYESAAILKKELENL